MLMKMSQSSLLYLEAERNELNEFEKQFVEKTAEETIENVVYDEVHNIAFETTHHVIFEDNKKVKKDIINQVLLKMVQGVVLDSVLPNNISGKPITI